MTDLETQHEDLPANLSGEGKSFIVVRLTRTFERCCQLHPSSGLTFWMGERLEYSKLGIPAHEARWRVVPKVNDLVGGRNTFSGSGYAPVPLCCLYVGLTIKLELVFAKQLST